MPGPVSRFRGCTSTFAPGRVASCGRASSMCPRLTIASIRSGGTNGATRASVASRSERLPMIRQYCLGIGAPAISRVRGWSRVPSPPARTRAQRRSEGGFILRFDAPTHTAVSSNDAACA